MRDVIRTSASSKRSKQQFNKTSNKSFINFYDKILIDEFQDFRQFDYDLLLLLCTYFPDTVLVGDFYQHSVAATNNSGKPFKKNITLNSFIENLEK